MKEQYFDVVQKAVNKLDDKLLTSFTEEIDKYVMKKYDTFKEVEIDEGNSSKQVVNPNQKKDMVIKDLTNNIKEAKLSHIKTKTSNSSIRRLKNFLFSLEWKVYQET